MRSLLFVEDQKTQREEGKIIAEQMGYHTSVASNLAEAFKILRTRPSISVIVTDIHLNNSPKASDENRDGRQIAVTARRENKNVTVIGTSGRFQKAQVCDADSPFDHFASKAWITDEGERTKLFQIIEGCIEKHSDAKIKDKEKLTEIVTPIELEGYTASEFFRHTEIKDVELVVVDNNDVASLTETSDLIAVPIPVWVKECVRSGKTLYYAEVYKLPSISTLGETKESALMLLIKLIKKLRSARNDDGAFPDFEDLGFDSEACQELMKYIAPEK